VHYSVGMETETSTVTISKATDGKLDVAVDGRTVARIADGDNLVRRAERHLRSAGVLRSSGYSLVAGVFTATAVVTR